MEKIDSIFKIDKKYKIDKIVPKDTIFSRKISNLIDRITIAYDLNSDNTNIKKYNDDARIYNGLLIFYIILRDDKIINDIISIITKKILTPSFIVFIYGDEVLISLNKTKTNRTDKNKNVVEERAILYIKNTKSLSESERKIINRLTFENIAIKSDFYQIYLHYIDLITTYNICNELNFDFENNKISLSELKKIHFEISNLNKELKILYGNLKNASTPEKFKINIKIKEIKDEITRLKLV